MAGAAILSRPMASVAAVSKKLNSIHSAAKNITIYHTNDLHGNINPVINNMGGLRQVKTLLKNQDTGGLLLDAGDFLSAAHSTIQQHELVAAMNNMGYIAATPGSNELLLGEDTLAGLIPHMQFRLVNCNYQFEGVLQKLITPYTIVNSGKFKIGITGIGHRVKGIKYLDPIQSANKTAQILKEKENCDLVICLSHLGYSQKDDMPDSQKLAAQSENIDLVINGYNNKLLKDPIIALNKQKREVIISHAAWGGLMMSRVVFGFEGKQKNEIKAKNIIAGQGSGQTSDEMIAEIRSVSKRLASA